MELLDQRLYDFRISINITELLPKWQQHVSDYFLPYDNPVYYKSVNFP
jgi:hypothetical protein